MEDRSRAALRVPREESPVSEAIGGLTLGNYVADRPPPPRPAPPPPSQELPPQSRMVSEGVVMTDITARFKAAASTLQPGELVKDGYFTLFEAVGALEIMDPKMDSGCVAPEDAEEDDYQIERTLLPTEVIGIIDQLLCLEMAWHLGYPLSQTLLTCLYITGILIPTPRCLDEADYLRSHSPADKRTIAHSVLRAYCIALISTCGSVNVNVRNEVYYEEEDLATNTYNLALLEDTSKDEIRQVLQEARAALIDADQSWPNNVVAALQSRLDFRETFLTAMDVAELRVQPDSLRTPWTLMTAAIKKIRDSHGLGVAVPGAFNTKMQGKLASTMPPRPIVQPSLDEALEHWTRLSEDAAEAVAILKYEDPQSLLTFQAKKPQPLVYIRTFVQGLIFFDNIMLGEHSIRQIMDDDLAIVVLPGSGLLDPLNDEVEAVQDPRFAISRFMEEFRIRSFPSYLEIYRTMCQNRSRSRRMMCHLLREWETLQMDVEEIDTQVQTVVDELAANGNASGALSSSSSGALALPLSSWAFLYKLRIMEWVVQLGFELEVYLPDELAGMYWYLSYLAKRRVQHAERIRTFTLRSLNELQQRNGGRDFTAHHEAAFTKSLLYLRTTMLDASVTWELADALSCLYASLHRVGLLKTPARPYSTDELRYEVRMKPFAVVGLPELPTFATFKTEAEQGSNSVAAILQYAEQALGGAKKGCEALTRFDENEAFAANCHARWVASTKNMYKSAIFAGLAVAALRKEVDRVETASGSAVGISGSTPVPLKLTVQVPKPDDSYHAWWLVPKLTPTA
ncbi:mak10 subunit [Ophiostoma piceae UAMH 11346]|uniref:Mak10 subunit n=1 Tax=Ophiostoma piceae (strain UAMH 11346) TaxID=1262450 RepID=S3BTI6_OPHP1|nr:mak10 subunit [Ophiostoma piceae UAMH 11346]